MIKKSLIITLLLFSNLGFGQSDGAVFFANFDRYSNAPISTTKEKVDSIMRWTKWADLDFTVDALEKTDSLIRTRINSSRSIQEEFQWNRLLIEIGTYNGIFGEALELIERNIEIATEVQDTSGLIANYNELAYLYFNNNLNELSLEPMYRSMELALQTKDSVEIKNTSSSYSWRMTNIAYEAGSKALQDSAAKYARMSFDYSEKGKGARGEGAFKTCLSLARADRREEAIAFAMKFINEELNPQNSMRPRLYNQIGDYYEYLEEADSARYYYELYISWFDEYSEPGPNTVIVEDGRRIGANKLRYVMYGFSRLGDHERVARYTDRVLYSDLQEEDESVIQDYRELGAIAYFETGQNKKAAECFEKAMAYNNDRFNVMIDQNEAANKANAETRIMLEKKKAEKFNQQQAEIAKHEKEKKEIQFKAFTFGSGVLVIFLFILYRRFRKTAKQKKIIEKQKVDVDNAYEELGEKNLEIIDSIQYAKRIQTAILPPDKLIKESLPDSFVLYKPKDIVAGDFYWLESFAKTSDSKGVLFAAADCTGHGVPGAMVSVICNNGLNRSVREFGLTDPAKILDKTREIVIQEFEKSEEEVKDGMDVALCSLELPSEGFKHLAGSGTVTLKYAGAHNPLWIIRSGADSVEEIKADKQPIGKFSEEKPFTSHEVSLSAGDSFYVFSDGYADQFGGPKGKKFKTANLKRLLLSIQDQSIEQQKVLLDDAFEDWRGTLEQLDDVCVIGLRV